MSIDAKNLMVMSQTTNKIEPLYERGKHEGPTLSAIIPSGFHAKLGLILGSISVLSLIIYGFDIGISFIFQLFYSYYDALTNILIGWIPNLFINIAKYFSIDVKIYAHWREIFILMSLYVIRDVMISLSDSDTLGGAKWRLFVWVFNGLIGSICCVSSAIIAGLYNLQESNLLQALGIMAIPMTSFFLYMAIDTIGIAIFFRKAWTRHIRIENPTFTKFVAVYLAIFLLRVLVPMFLLSTFLIYYDYFSPSESAVIFLLGFILCQAFYNIIFGLQSEFFGDNKNGWFGRFVRGYHFKLGTSILLVFINTFMFLALNAGLSMVGL